MSGVPITTKLACMVHGRPRSDRELAALHASLSLGLDEAGRAPALQGARLVVSRGGAAVWAGAPVPHALAASLHDPEKAPVADDLSQPSQLDALRSLLAGWRSPVRVEGGPIYTFGNVPVVEPPRGVELVTSEDRGQPDLVDARPPSWEPDEWRSLLAGRMGPWALAVERGAVLSCCHTPLAVTAEAAECGVWTRPSHRGKGLAAATIAAWTNVLAGRSEHLFYCADADNVASKRVAEKLGLRLIGWGWTLTAGAWPEGDTWGRALLDHHIGRYVPRLELENEAGDIGPAMHPVWFFRGFEDWDWWERDLLAAVTRGPVLDLGAGAGRASLWAQGQGLDVTAVESSPLAAEVCRLRGVRDVRVGDLNEPPSDRRWSAVLLLCGNLGLGGSWDGIRQLLSRLAATAAPDAILLGDTVDAGSGAQTSLRIRYRGEATPWWPQYNVSVAEVPALIEGTGWRLERHLVDGADHAVLLRRAAEG